MAPRRADMIGAGLLRGLLRGLLPALALLALLALLAPGTAAQDDGAAHTAPPVDPAPVLQATENRIDVSNQKLRCLYLPGVKAADTPPPTHLDASNNLLTDIHDNVLHGLYLLRSLNLSGNLMHEWGRYPFRDLRSLELLDVSRNQFRNVDRVVLEPLQALRRLNVSGNRITYLDTAAFPAMHTLLDLDLTHNDMEVIADDAFSRLASLQRLDLRWNRLATLGERTLRGLTAVQTVLLGGNIISEAVPGALQGLNSLSEISLADNQQVVDLVLVGNRLQRVDLSRIGLSAVPAALTRSVRVLLLPGNNLRIISCGDLDSFPLLQAVELSSNGLALIEDDALGRLEQLETLLLRNNSLMMIPPSLPASLVSLQLQANQIRHIGANDLRGLVHLEKLDLSGNQVHHIHDGAFRFLEKLQELDLSGNNLLELRAAALAGPVALRSLRLVHLPDIVAPAKWLPFPVVRPERLQLLDLDQSPQLARQLLADTAALMAMPHLQTLRLGAAELHHLRSDLPRLLAHLQHLKLADNPWNCAGLRWLPRWLLQLNADSGSGATCRQPAELAGLQLRNLTDAHFNASQLDEGEEEDPPPPLALPLGDRRRNEEEAALADEEVSIPINEYKRIMIELNKTLAREAAAKEAAATATTGTPLTTNLSAAAVNVTSPVAATELPASAAPPPVAAALSATTSGDTPSTTVSTSTTTTRASSVDTASSSATSSGTTITNTAATTTASTTTAATTTVTATQPSSLPSRPTATPPSPAIAASQAPPQAAAQVQGAPVTTKAANSTTAAPPPTTALYTDTTAKQPTTSAPTTTSQAPTSHAPPPSAAPTSTATTPPASSSVPPPASSSVPPPDSRPASQSASSTPTSTGLPSSSTARTVVATGAGVAAGEVEETVTNNTATSLRHVASPVGAAEADDVVSGDALDSRVQRPGGAVTISRHTTSVVAMFAVAVCCSVAVLLAFAIARNSRHRRQQLHRLHSMEDLVLRGRGPDGGLDASDCHCGHGLHGLAHLGADPRRDGGGPELW